jgi:dihydrofolate reductase
MDRNRLIGSGAGLPWHVPDESAHFLSLIEGQTVILGRKSYPAFGRNLTSAHNIVVSKSVGELPGAVIVSTIEEACSLAASFGKTVFSAGGASIYEQTLPLASHMYLSYMKGRYHGDSYFPIFDVSQWEAVSREDHAEFEFVVFQRRARDQAR